MISRVSVGLFFYEYHYSPHKLAFQNIICGRATRNNTIIIGKISKLAMPIDNARAYSMHNACRPYAFCSCAAYIVQSCIIMN